VDLDCAQPGRHSVQNAAAAACVAHLLGVDARSIANAIRSFPGISRRFEVLGTTESGIRVVDDYAHNADKIRAAVTAAQAGCDRLIAIFQPHGFGPARFLRPDLKALLPQILRPRDRFAYAPIYYAGGSVAQDISSLDLASDIACRGCADKDEVVAWACETAYTGDTVLLMGARDPDLPLLARRLYALL
jgi:UDP-N-acetylmuramate--alanine ligase